MAQEIARLKVNLFGPLRSYHVYNTRSKLNSMGSKANVQDLNAPCNWLDPGLRRACHVGPGLSAVTTLGWVWLGIVEPAKSRQLHVEALSANRYSSIEWGKVGHKALRFHPRQLLVMTFQEKEARRTKQSCHARQRLLTPLFEDDRAPELNGNGVQQDQWHSSYCQLSLPLAFRNFTYPP